MNHRQSQEEYGKQIATLLQNEANDTFADSQVLGERKTSLALPVSASNRAVQ